MAVEHIAVSELGSGPVVVLVHGFPLDGRVWEGVAPELAKRHRVIVPDLPGFGKSTPAAGISFTIESLADALRARLKLLGVERFTLAGLSMGGYVALAYAKKYEADLAGLVLVDTRSGADASEGKAGREKMIELVRDKGTAAVVEQMLPKMLAPVTFERRPDVVARLKEIMHDCPAPTIAAACAAMRDREDYTPYLPKFSVPTLLVVGAHDAITPLAFAESVAGALPKGLGRVEVITDAGHMSPLEQPHAVATAIQNWMVDVKSVDHVRQ